MIRRNVVLVAASGALLAGVLAFAPQAQAGSAKHGTVRFATFNASLNRPTQGRLIADLSAPDNAQARTIAEIVQRERPDVLLVNEFDYDAAGEAAALFQRNYLSVGQQGARPIEYRYRYTAPSNTGVATGFDLNNDGRVVTTPGQPGYGDDSYGFGEFPGQYGMVVYSKYPIDTKRARTFQNFRWQDMPGAVLPPGWYSPEEQAAFRLSSKSHWDLPIKIGRRTVHLLASHPTPPTFDGAEDRNGRRNHDEIRFWADYIKGARYIYDDQGRRGGLKLGSTFVIAGDQNADPNDGDSYQGAIHQLLDHPLVNDRFTPESEGAAEASALQGAANANHRGDPAQDTADFADALPNGPGNLRADYVLPSAWLRITDGGVFWPVRADPLSRLTGTFPFPSSDHRSVWIDVRL
jgi:Endonuclease/Exonuclease/phosphatase family